MEQIINARRCRAGNVVWIQTVVQHDVPCFAARFVAVAVAVRAEEIAVHQTESRRIAERLWQREIEHCHADGNDDLIRSYHDGCVSGIIACRRFAVRSDCHRLYLECRSREP